MQIASEICNPQNNTIVYTSTNEITFEKEDRQHDLVNVPLKEDQTQQHHRQQQRQIRYIEPLPPPPSVKRRTRREFDARRRRFFREENSECQKQDSMLCRPSSIRSRSVRRSSKRAVGDSTHRVKVNHQNTFSSSCTAQHHSPPLKPHVFSSRRGLRNQIEENTRHTHRRTRSVPRRSTVPKLDFRVATASTVSSRSKSRSSKHEANRVRPLTPQASPSASPTLRRHCHRRRAFVPNLLQQNALVTRIDLTPRTAHRKVSLQDSHNPSTLNARSFHAAFAKANLVVSSMNNESDKADEMSEGYSAEGSRTPMKEKESEILERPKRWSGIKNFVDVSKPGRLEAHQEPSPNLPQDNVKAVSDIINSPTVDEKSKEHSTNVWNSCAEGLTDDEMLDALENDAMILARRLRESRHTHIRLHKHN